MRTTFGDYRVKMEKDEEKFKLEPTVRCPSDPASSQFIKRKRTGLTADQSLSADLENVRLAPDPTKVEEELKYDNVVVTAKSDDPVTANSFHYQPSSNTFRFNFTPTAE